MDNNYNSVTISLTVSDVDEAIKFYNQAFGAKELSRITLPDGTIAHAEFQIGDTIIMISGESAEF